MINKKGESYQAGYGLGMQLSNSIHLGESTIQDAHAIAKLSAEGSPWRQGFIDACKEIIKREKEQKR